MATQYQVAGSLIGTREVAIRVAIETWAGNTPPSEWTEDQIRESLPGWCRAPEGVDQAELDAEVVQAAIALMQASRTVHCECGEDATVRLGRASQCDECFQRDARAALAAAGYGQICARLMRHGHGLRSLCLTPYGEEHDHDH